MAGVLGTPVHLSAPLCDPSDVTKRQRLGDDPHEEVPPDSEAALDPRRFLFCEFFAGEGALTSAVSAAGVPVRSPEDLAGGGIDFSEGERRWRGFWAPPSTSARPRATPMTSPRGNGLVTIIPK